MKRPKRSCVGCREARFKDDLLRLVIAQSGEVIFDPSGKLLGRGAYLCKNSDCFSVAKKRDAIARALKIRLSQEDYCNLEKEFNNLCAS